MLIKHVSFVCLFILQQMPVARYLLCDLVTQRIRLHLITMEYKVKLTDMLDKPWRKPPFILVEMKFWIVIDSCRNPAKSTQIVVINAFSLHVLHRIVIEAVQWHKPIKIMIIIVLPTPSNIAKPKHKSRCQSNIVSSCFATLL